MNQQTTQSARIGGFQWSLYSPDESGTESLIREHLDDMKKRLSALAPDDREWFTIENEGGKGYFVKVFRHDSFLQRSRYTLFGSQAETEWSYLIRLFEENVYVPIPVALGQHSSSGLLDACVLITEQLDGTTLNEMLQEQYGTEHWTQLRSQLWSSLAHVSAQLIENGFHHRDYHSGNFMVVPKGNLSDAPAQLTIYVTDLHRASMSSSLSSRKISKMLAFLVYSLRPEVPFWECRRFYRRLEQKRPADGALPDWSTVLDDVQKRKREHRVSRTSDCLKESENVYISTPDDEWTIYHDPSVSGEKVLDWIRMTNDESEQTRLTVLKERSDGRVVRLGGGENDLVIEETSGTLLKRKCQRAIGQSKARKSWKNTWGLRVRDIPVSEGVALAEPNNSFSDHPSYFIRTFVPGCRVDDYLEHQLGEEGQKQEPERTALLKALVRYVSTLHREGVYHKDMKANNVIVAKSTPGWDFQLIDLDRVSFYDHPLPAEPRIKNLVQLNASLEEQINQKECRNAWERYLNWPGVPFSDPREVRKQIIERSRRRLDS